MGRERYQGVPGTPAGDSFAKPTNEPLGADAWTPKRGV
jgi:hypothetical protein